MISCSDYGLIYFLLIVKKIFNLILILAPILLIIMLVIHFKNLMSNPDNQKKDLAKVRNSIIATVVIVFIPVIINALFMIIGTNTSFTSCWNSIDTNTKMEKALYMVDEEPEVNQNTGLLINPGDYQKGKQNTTTSNYSNYSSKQEALLSALDKMSKQISEDYNNGIIWKYKNSNTRGSFQSARESSRVCNCALLAVWGLVEIDVLEPGEIFYTRYKDGINEVVMSENVKNKLLSQGTIIDGNGQIAKKLAEQGQLQAGDIVFWEDTGHTNIYAGNFEFYEGGRVGTNGIGTMDDYTFTSFGPNGGGYINNKVFKIYRLN